MNIGIIGLGLIGGSLIKKLHSSCDVTGYDLAEAVRQKAKQAGFRVRNTLSDLLQNSEIVIIASPTNSALEILKDITKQNFKGLISDIGSTKLPIHKALSKNANFVGGHPMAGSHLAGWDSSEAELFNQAPWALTLDQVKSESHLVVLIDMILKTGAWVVPTTAAEHDQAVLISSHLPHLISAGYGLSVEKSQDHKLIQQLVGGSFKDLTRITLSPSARTSEIIWPNRAELIQSIDEFVSNLQILKKSLKNEESTALLNNLQAASRARFSVEDLLQKIKTKNLEHLKVAKGELISQLSNLSTSASAIINFKVSGETYDISFVK
jgi:prephenate dehydrogenase